MSPQIPLVDASVAAALIAPDPNSYITSDNEKTDGKLNPNDQQSGGSGAGEDDQKPKAKLKTKQQQQKSAPPTIDERFYAVDAEMLQKLRKEKPWAKPDTMSSQQQQQQQQQRQGGLGMQGIGTTQSTPRPVAKYFESLSLSPSAVTKIMMHCQSGVEKGISKGGNPIEVMGLMLGRPDPYKSTNLIVTDAFPLPIEGFETRVVADDQNVVNHMISLGERLEATRSEKFMGWYHSHPFDLVLGEESRSHCFLSQTDLSTQLQWQRAEDPHGNPFAAIVVDPLLSMHTGTPQLKAFRAYPPEYQSTICNECPDGSIVSREKQRLEKWGSCWNRYYELKIDYYMSEASRSILGDLTQDYLWMKSFQRESSEGGGNTQGVSGLEATKVGALREIATNIGSEERSSTMPQASSTTEPMVRKLREMAVQAATQQTCRFCHMNIFRLLNNKQKKEESKEISGDDAIATTITR